MLYAIFESGGKQFKAVEGSFVEVDHLPTEEGKKVSFDKVLLLVNDKDIQVGTPFIKGASIDTTVATHFKAKKVIIFNYRPKKHYRVKTGHRQQYTRLMVNSITFTGKPAKAAIEEKPVVKAEKPAAKTEKPVKPVEKKIAVTKTPNSPKPATPKKTTTPAVKTGSKTTKPVKAEKK
jgi:large subunit ribosomal protein L21